MRLPCGLKHTSPLSEPSVGGITVTRTRPSKRPANPPEFVFTPLTPAAPLPPELSPNTPSPLSLPPSTPLPLVLSPTTPSWVKLLLIKASSWSLWTYNAMESPPSTSSLPVDGCVVPMPTLPLVSIVILGVLSLVKNRADDPTSCPASRPSHQHKCRQSPLRKNGSPRSPGRSRSALIAGCSSRRRHCH